MNADELRVIIDAADRTHKYVWLKHDSDRTPSLGTFAISDDGYLKVGLYLSFIDDYEGIMKIRPENVEWAHVSTKTWESDLRERLTYAETSNTLVRLHFSDFIEPQLFNHQFYNSDNGTVAFGNFVHEQTRSSDPTRSRIPLRILLDIENTDIPSSSINESEEFAHVCDEPNLCHFAEKVA